MEKTFETEYAQISRISLQSASPEMKTSRVHSPIRKKRSSKKTEVKSDHVIGIMISIALSILIAGCILFGAIVVGPPVLRSVLNLLQKLTSYLVVKEANLLQMVNLTHQQFLEEFASKRPVLLQSSMSEQARKEALTLLDSTYGSVRVSYASISSLTRSVLRETEEGSGYLGGVLRFAKTNMGNGFETSLSKYRNMSWSQDAYDPLYLKDRKVTKKMPKLVQLLSIPSQIKQCLNNGVCTSSHSTVVGSASAGVMGRVTSMVSKLKNKVQQFGKKEDIVVRRDKGGPKLPRDDGAYFDNNVQVELSVGKQGSGMSFHVDDECLVEVLDGTVKWFLYEPSRLPITGFDPAEPLSVWINGNYEGLWQKQMPVEVTQSAGQVLYIPAGWYRGSAVVSPESILFTHVESRCDKIHIDSILSGGPHGVDVAVTADSPATALCLVREALRKEKANEWKAAADLLQRALELSPDAQTHAFLGRTLLAVEDLDGAEMAFRKSISSNYRNPEGYSNLVGLWESKLEHVESEAEGSRLKGEIINLVKFANKMNISSNDAKMKLIYERYSEHHR